MITGKEMRVRLTFTEPILGGEPGNKDIYRDYIGSKAPDAETLAEELEYLPEEEVVDKGKTIFHRLDDGTPVLLDNHIRGFFKSTCGFLRKVSGSESSKIKAYKKEIDGLIFVFGDCKGSKKPIRIQNVKEIGELQRPLRAQTAQGERISLAISEMIPEGCFVEFTIAMMKKGHEPAVREWLDYGEYTGIGQWRNASYGRFTWEELPPADPKAKKNDAVKFV